MAFKKKKPNHNDDPQKQELIRKRNFSLRLNFFFFIAFFVFSVLIVRLAMLQFVEGPTLAAKEDQKTTASVAIPPIRGNILDRTGVPIAYSTSTQSLYYRIEPGQKKDDVIALANRLAEIFEEFGDKDPGKAPLTAEEIVKSMDVGFDINKVEKRTLNFASEPRRIKTALSNREIAYLMEHQDEFKGIEINEESIREYDKSTVSVQLVGYLRQYDRAVNTIDYYKQISELPKEKVDPTNKYLRFENVGFDGLELMYQEQLRGKNGLKTYPVNAAHKIVGSVTVTPPEKGNNLFLTIDKKVQLTAEKAIMDNIKVINKASGNRFQYAPNAKAGYAVAMEVDTGKVVAMASMPDYDPAIWKTGRISPELLAANEKRLTNGTIRTAASDWPDNVLKNYPTSIVPLGSTQKPLTVLVGMAEKVIGPNTPYNDRGIFYYGRNNAEDLTNADDHAYGMLTPSRAIEKSSNTFMAEMVGNALYKKYKGSKAVDVWDAYMKKFGLGVVTESGLPNESEGTLDYFHEVKSGSAQSAMILASFGQQARYTTLQLAQYTAMLANKGSRMKPQFVEKIMTNDNKTLVQGYKPEVLNKVEFPNSYWKVIHQGMEKVKKQGFEGFPYKVASKTGTSQQDVGKRKAIENAVFIAYAPADNPKLAVAVVVPDGGYGGWGAAPIARQIFEAYDEEIGLTGVPKKKPVTPTGQAASGTSAGTQ
ncbi:cell division protein FtsI [Paenibacillus swuensis]|uniref:Cell division protein FtsI n=1 Tax=Paenibacillus swuensis TaxID=1178515 RepID=A0A172TDQ4_9BACL|nr:penicillin-binding transpeptidase domain-containing protein [Paenibacillus swuensis]ANE45064.1 cell division protein FtsI [Paenibacillus swuensis]